MAQNRTKSLIFLEKAKWDFLSGFSTTVGGMHGTLFKGNMILLGH